MFVLQINMLIVQVGHKNAVPLMWSLYWNYKRNVVILYTFLNDNKLQEKTLYNFFKKVPKKRPAAEDLFKNEKTYIFCMIKFV